MTITPSSLVLRSILLNYFYHHHCCCCCLRVQIIILVIVLLCPIEHESRGTWFIMAERTDSITTTSSSTTMEFDRIQHQQCPTTTTTTTMFPIGINNNNDDHTKQNIRHVILPDRSLLKEILFQYYDTHQDTYYDDNDDGDENNKKKNEEICRVRVVLCCVWYNQIFLFRETNEFQHATHLTHTFCLILCYCYVGSSYIAYGDGRIIDRRTTNRSSDVVRILGL